MKVLCFTHPSTPTSFLCGLCHSLRHLTFFERLILQQMGLIPCTFVWETRVSDKMSGMVNGIWQSGNENGLSCIIGNRIHRFWSFIHFKGTKSGYLGLCFLDFDHTFKKICLFWIPQLCRSVIKCVSTHSNVGEISADLPGKYLDLKVVEFSLFLNFDTSSSNNLGNTFSHDDNESKFRQTEYLIYCFWSFIAIQKV